MKEHSKVLSGALPVYDERRTIYSPLEFQDDRLEFFISLPLSVGKTVSPLELVQHKIFRVNIKLVSNFPCFKDHYDYDILHRNLPCLQISRRKACYLPMELCLICEGQKFLGKLSDDQTAKLLKISCQRPSQRKAIIDRVMEGPAGPTSGDQAKEFKLQVTREMTRLKGRLLQPPKLKLGHGGYIQNLTPSRHDRQWNLMDSHVFEGTRAERWAIISFGGSIDQKSSVPKFMHQLSQRCEQLDILMNKCIRS